MVEIHEEIDPYAQEETEEETEADEYIDYDQLKKRMWKDRILLQKLKEKRHKDESDQELEAKQEASRRKMSSTRLSQHLNEVEEIAGRTLEDNVGYMALKILNCMQHWIEMVRDNMDLTQNQASAYISHKAKKKQPHFGTWHSIQCKSNVFNVISTP